MLELKRVSDEMSVAGQITLDDVGEIARLGFRRIINNRPDGESPGQPRSDEMRRQAEAAGLLYVYAPFRGAPTPFALEALDQAAREGGRTLAHCRSGTRSITAWATAEVLGRRRSPRGAVEAARAAGYDLSPHLGALERMARD